MLRQSAAKKYMQHKKKQKSIPLPRKRTVPLSVVRVRRRRSQTVYFRIHKQSTSFIETFLRIHTMELQITAKYIFDIHKL